MYHEKREDLFRRKNGVLWGCGLSQTTTGSTGESKAQRAGARVDQPAH
jgi:hypothetical protein